MEEKLLFSICLEQSINLQLEVYVYFISIPGIDGYKVDQTNKDADVSKIRRDKIGIVFQTFNLLALMSAYENIELPMRIKG